MMKIGFHTNGLSLRGTEIALYDYAHHNQQLLGNESLVFYRKNHSVDQSVFEKFSKQFKLIPYDGQKELNHLIEQEKVNLTYFIKSGERDDAICESSPSLIHAVFPTKPEEFHGDKYAFVSQWLSKEYSNNKIPFVPHMIELPEGNGNLRVELGIPESATVLGWYGGSDSFNLEFVKKEVELAVQKRPDLYFLFMNMKPFAKHERLLFLPGNSDLDFKVRFINTCDGMLHARGIGESFGLACGEFSIKGKPVITYALSPQRSHIEILGDKAILYKGKKDLSEVFQNFHRNIQTEKNWDAYSKYFNSKEIMRKFEEVFILGKNLKDISLSSADHLAIQQYRLKRKFRNLQKRIYL
jgi:ribosomal protein S24E